jgi:hypothetical protein
MIPKSPRKVNEDSGDEPQLPVRGRRTATDMVSPRLSEVSVAQKSPRNWVTSEEGDDAPGGIRARRTATESDISSISQIPKVLPPARKRLGTQYRPKLSTEQQQEQKPVRPLSSLRPAIVVSEASKQRVKAYKHFLFEYYSTWFKYLNQRKARMEATEREVRLMPGDSGQTHKAELLRKESLYLRQRRRKMRLGEFQILALLGKGAFGAVFLARKRDTGEVLAVKKISKAQFDASNKDRVLREKKVLQVASHSPWLVGLAYAFQDKEFLFLAME